MADAELARLQRQYRIMEQDRKAYCEEATNIVRKQKAEVELLEREKSEIEVKLDLAKSNQNQMMDRQNTLTLIELVRTRDEYEAQIKEERKRIQELDVQTQAMDKKISQQRRTMGGVFNADQKRLALRKKMLILENRLNKTMTKFNSVLHENSELRSNIDHLRQERALYDSLQKKLLRELAEGKQEMGELIEQSTVAYDQRDEAQNKMIALTERRDKDKIQYDNEMKELQRILDHDQKLKEFMTIKNQERNSQKAVEEQTKKKKKDGTKEETDEETITQYEEAFRRIREVKGDEDIDTLVTNFIKTEDENFALFNYVNELNNDVEIVAEQIENIQSDIDQFKTESSVMEQERQSVMNDLEDKIKTAKEEADTATSKFGSSTKILTDLKDSVQEMFDKIGCSKAEIEELLGSAAGVTDNNIVLYLSIIEQRTNELLQIQHYLQHKFYERYKRLEYQRFDEVPAGPFKNAVLMNMKKKYQEQEDAPPPPPNPLIAAGIASTSQTTINIVPPTTGEEFASDDEAEQLDDFARPLTSGELRNKVIKGITKRDYGPPGGGVANAGKQQTANYQPKKIDTMKKTKK